MDEGHISFVKTALDDRIIDWLKQYNLPTDDLPSESIEFYEGVVSGSRVCAGALQTLDSNVLLRSVVVSPEKQGNGYGQALTQFLLKQVRTSQSESVYLLTTTADSFFKKLEFFEIEREALPTSIQSTEEGESLCPDTAVCMKYKSDNSL